MVEAAGKEDKVAPVALGKDEDSKSKYGFH